MYFLNGRVTVSLTAISLVAFLLEVKAAVFLRQPQDSRANLQDCHKAVSQKL